MTERIRLTISVPADTHEIFTAMADSAGMSVGRCMGDWLTDTSDAAQLIVTKMNEARRAPGQFIREMQAMATGLREEVDTVAEIVRKGKRGGAEGRQAQPAPRRTPPVAPSSNTGRKSTQSTPRRGQK